MSLAGAAFGTVENLSSYLLPYIIGNGDGGVATGIGGAVARAISSVPLHIGTALLMGVIMGHNKFIKGKDETWYVVLTLSI